ncbi:hypothetical protein KFE25_005290 [Diacronema lutheri]|uniref:R3H domain-containing protein n=2 Tax=Diacronema lutheri TaxID=2081491 RepID=A0A8J5XPQ0_DIALT|nr:hypothetical protein KFE25_005290 [Diacronema lutheri]
MALYVPPHKRGAGALAAERSPAALASRRGRSRACDDASGPAGGAHGAVREMELPALELFGPVEDAREPEVLVRAQRGALPASFAASLCALPFVLPAQAGGAADADAEPLVDSAAARAAAALRADGEARLVMRWSDAHVDQLLCGWLAATPARACASVAFASSLSRPQRALVHEAAERAQLGSVSVGVGRDRAVTVTRQPAERQPRTGACAPDGDGREAAWARVVWRWAQLEPERCWWHLSQNEVAHLLAAKPRGDADSPLRAALDGLVARHTRALRLCDLLAAGELAQAEDLARGDGQSQPHGDAPGLVGCACAYAAAAFAQVDGADSARCGTRVGVGEGGAACGGGSGNGGGSAGGGSCGVHAESPLHALVRAVPVLAARCSCAARKGGPCCARAVCARVGALFEWLLCAEGGAAVRFVDARDSAGRTALQLVDGLGDGLGDGLQRRDSCVYEFERLAQQLRKALLLRGANASLPLLARAPGSARTRPLARAPAPPRFAAAARAPAGACAHGRTAAARGAPAGVASECAAGHSALPPDAARAPAAAAAPPRSADCAEHPRSADCAEHPRSADCAEHPARPRTASPPPSPPPACVGSVPRSRQPLAASQPEGDACAMASHSAPSGARACGRACCGGVTVERQSRLFQQIVAIQRDRRAFDESVDARKRHLQRWQSHSRIMLGPTSGAVDGARAGLAAGHAPGPALGCAAARQPCSDVARGDGDGFSCASRRHSSD